MIGVQAISGGLVAIFVLCGFLLISACGLSAGVLLASRRKYAPAIVLIACAIGIVSFIVKLLLSTFNTPINDIAIDTRNTNIAAWKSNLFSCRVVVEEKTCFVSGIAKLRLILPDKMALAMEGANLYVDLDARDKLRKVAFSIYPEPDGAGLIKLLDQEETASQVYTIEEGEKRAKFRNAVASNGLTELDQHVVFRRNGYDIHLWLLPRTDKFRGYFVWYEILIRSDPSATS